MVLCLMYGIYINAVRVHVDEDWLEGSLQGQKGIFPASLIDHVPARLHVPGEEGGG